MKWARGLLAAVSLALCLTGMATAMQGAAVPVKARLAQARLEQVFEQRLATSGASLEEQVVADTSAPRAPTARSREASALPAGGPIARISVERLGVREIVLAGDGTHEQLARAPTMLKRGDGASPVTVLAAHRDTHFLFIRDLREGDEVTLQRITGEVERYRVTRLETVRWDSFAYPLDPVRPLLALTTCYPFGGTEYGTPWRRVAWAEAIT